MSVTKEPNFFLFDRRGAQPVPLVADRRIAVKSVTDRDSYDRLFHAHGERAVGEASPLYLYTAGTPELIAATLPEVKLVAVVREPVARAYSHFVYVHDDLGERAPEAFAAAALEELPLPETPYLGGTHSLRLSRYAPQLQRYLAVFPRDRLLVLPFDEVQGEPDRALARACRFLGVDDGFRFDTGRHYAPSAAGARMSVDRMLKPVRPYLKRALPPTVAGALARRRAARQAAYAAPPPTVPAATRQLLAAYFDASNAWLREEFGIDVAGQDQQPGAHGP